MVTDCRFWRGAHRAVCVCRSGAHSDVRVAAAVIARAQLGGQRMRNRIRVRLAVAFVAWQSFHLQRSHHLGTGLVARRAFFRFPFATGRGQRTDTRTAGIFVLCRWRAAFARHLRRTFHPDRALSCSWNTTRQSRN